MQGQLGVEMEVILPGGLRVLRRRAHGALRASVHDPSVGIAGGEVRWRGHASPRSYASLARLIEGLRRRRAGINERCGLHVHIGLDVYRGAALRPVARWLGSQMYVRQLFPERDDNPFCKPIHEPRDCIQHHSEISVSRKRPTLEFRLHPGTVLWPQVVCWADWCDALVRCRESPLGDAYLAARRWNLAQLGWANPLLWTSRIVDDAEAVGIKNTLNLISHGAYADMEQHNAR